MITGGLGSLGAERNHRRTVPGLLNLRNGEHGAFLDRVRRRERVQEQRRSFMTVSKIRFYRRGVLTRRAHAHNHGVVAFALGHVLEGVDHVERVTRYGRAHRLAVSPPRGDTYRRLQGDRELAAVIVFVLGAGGRVGAQVERYTSPYHLLFYVTPRKYILVL